MDSGRKRILIFTQHLAGVGHFFRTSLIARGLSQDFDVFLIHGGRRIPGTSLPEMIRVFFLDPVYYRVLSETDPYGSTEEDLESYVPENSNLDIHAVFERRRQRILEIVDEVKPDIFLIEHFPFSRWAQAYELLPAIDQVRKQRGRVVCSLRDIVRNPNRSVLSETDRYQWKGEFRKKDQKIFDILNDYFDCLLIHADPEVTRLEEHLAEKSVDGIHIPIYYTGYVAERLGLSNRSSTCVEDLKTNGFVLVSAGGSLEGFAVFEPSIHAWKALAAKEKTANRSMVICCGPYLEPADYEELKSLCDNGPFRILPFTSNFLFMMKVADFSVSRAGYNTCMNILESGTPSLVIPSYAMSDQICRAERLKSLGVVDVIDETQVTPDAIAAAIEKGLKSRPAPHKVALNGADRTRELLGSL